MGAPSGRLDEVVRHIRNLLRDGRLRSGDRLPSERTLANDLGVGRPVVREALRMLESTGLIEVRRGSGAYASSHGRASLLQGLLAGGEPRRKELFDLLEVRRALEIEIAGLAAERADADALTPLADNLDAFERLVDALNPETHYDAMFKLDLDFHVLLSRSTGNLFFTHILESLVELMLRSRQVTIRTPGGPRRTLAFHRAVLAAVRAGDAVRARRAMLEHLEDVRILLTVYGT